MTWEWGGFCSRGLITKGAVGKALSDGHGKRIVHLLHPVKEELENVRESPKVQHGPILVQFIFDTIVSL